MSFSLHGTSSDDRCCLVVVYQLPSVAVELVVVALGDLQSGASVAVVPDPLDERPRVALVFSQLLDMVAARYPNRLWKERA